jgi:hypothetical protein
MSALRFIVGAIVVLAVGLVAYQMGLSQGLATTVPAGAAPVAYYGYPHWGWGFGFGFLGLLFPLLFFFLIFAALSAAWRGGRGGHGRGWGNGRERIEQIHRELHGEKPSADRPSSTST